MYSYRDQLEFIKNIKIAEGDRKTIDCPFCGGKKKFTIDRYDGKLIWNCYKASCNVRGAYNGKRSIEEAKAFIANNAIKRKKAQSYPIPQITTKVENHKPAVDFLKSVNSWVAYEKGYIKITYAPAEDRVLFYNADHTGAVGRSLRPAKAKWWTYGTVEGGITVGNGEHVVLVEDVPSACAVAQVNGYVGLSLLGTDITKPIKKTLSSYKKVTLVLDNDASAKAVSIIRKCSLIDRLRLTKKDLKWLTGNQIKEMLR